jgi:hypothetical protein
MIVAIARADEPRCSRDFGCARFVRGGKAMPTEPIGLI